MIRVFILGLIGVFGASVDGYAFDFGDDTFSSSDPSLGALDHADSRGSPPWHFSVSGGATFINNADTSLSAPISRLTIGFNGENFFLNFPARTFVAKKFGTGYAVQAHLLRQITNGISIGLQAGSSFKSAETEETGLIPFTTFDSNGAILSQKLSSYSINYEVTIYHIEPVVEIGPWIPLGRRACRPYFSFGAGLTQIVETANFSVESADIDIARRSTTALGTLAGGGIDFRFTPSGAVGVEYQIQRVFTTPHGWTISLPSARFSYLF